MITQAESGLSADDYGFIEDAVSNAGSPTATFNIHRYNPALAAGAAEETYDGYHYRVLVDEANMRYVRFYIDGGTLYIQYSDTLAAWTDDIVWQAASSLVTGVADVAPAIGIDPDAPTSVRLFYLKLSGATYQLYYRDGTSFGAWGSETTATGCTVADLPNFLRATDLTNVWYDKLYPIQGNTSLGIFSYFSGPSWFAGEIEYYWPGTWSGMDVIRIDEATNKHVVAIAASFNPHLGNAIEDGQLVRVAHSRGGIAVFEVYSGWQGGQHRVVEVFDDWGLYQHRLQVRLAQHDDTYYMTCWGTDGDAKHSESHVHIMKSTDGINWSRPLLVAADLPYGCELLIVPDTLHLVDGGRVYTSKASYWFGGADNVHPTWTQDITQYVVTTQINLGAMPQIELQLSNANNQLDELLIMTDATFVLTFALGYWVSDPAQPELGYWQALVNRAVLMIERIVTDDTVGSHDVSVIARGMLSLLSDVNKSPYLVERQTQNLGVDHFEDQSQTGYGGLRHTAAQIGAWRTEDGLLYLSSHNKEGIAFTTFVSEVQNGFIQVKVDWSKDGEGEYVGVVFWAYDNSNYWTIRYSPDTNFFYLIRVEEGVAEEIDSYAYSGFTLGGDNWMRVETYYGNITLRISVNGGTDWTIENTWENVKSVAPAPSSSGSDPSISRLINSGSMGLIGWGFSPEDHWKRERRKIKPPVRTPAPDWGGWKKPPPRDPGGEGPASRMEKVRSILDVQYGWGIDAVTSIVYQIEWPFTAGRRIVPFLDLHALLIPSEWNPANFTRIETFALDPWHPDFNMMVALSDGDNEHFHLFDVTGIKGSGAPLRVRETFVSPTSVFVDQIRIHYSTRFMHNVFVTWRALVSETAGDGNDWEYKNYISYRTSPYGQWSTPEVVSTVVYPNPSGLPLVHHELPAPLALHPQAYHNSNGLALTVGGYDSGVNGYQIKRSYTYGRTWEATPAYTWPNHWPVRIVIPNDPTLNPQEPWSIVNNNEFWYAWGFDVTGSTGESATNASLIRYNNGVVTNIAPVNLFVGGDYMTAVLDAGLLHLDIALDVYAHDPERILLHHTNNDYFWISEDGGDTWKARWLTYGGRYPDNSTAGGDPYTETELATIGIDNEVGFYGNQLLYARHIRFSPYNPDHLYAYGESDESGKADVWYSLDGGLHWTSLFSDVYAGHVPDTNINYVNVLEFLWWK
jgi:hypothetical protein